MKGPGISTDKMEMIIKTTCLLVALIAIAGPGYAQTLAESPNTIVCDKNSGCSNQYIDGHMYKTIANDQILVTTEIEFFGRYARARVLVMNKSKNSFNVLPEHFKLFEVTPKEKNLPYLSYQKILKSDASRAGWANALNAFGAGMARQQVTTQTNSSGTVNATSSDGTYTNGSYNGTSTSTTSVPDYAAQAQAQENIRRRREALASESAAMSQSSLKDNTVLSGQSVSGFVYFEWDKKTKDSKLCILVDGITYVFPWVTVKF